MAISVSEIKEWLNTLPADALVGVDDGGLCLRVVGDHIPYCEIGGLPDEEEFNERTVQTWQTEK